VRRLSAPRTALGSARTPTAVGADATPNRTIQSSAGSHSDAARQIAAVITAASAIQRVGRGRRSSAYPAATIAPIEHQEAQLTSTPAAGAGIPRAISSAGVKLTNTTQAAFNNAKATPATSTRRSSGDVMAQNGGRGAPLTSPGRTGSPYRSATSASTDPVAAAVATTAVRQSVALARPPRVAIATAMPSGKVASIRPSAVAISLPANQSVVIFATCIVTSTPPAPLSRRATIAIPREELTASSPDPTVSSPSAPSSVALSPRRPLTSPPGRAMKTPGSMNSPMSIPSSA
jgi:hypothetical protein